MGIKTVTHRPYSPDLAPYDFWLFPKLRGSRYETIEEMKAAVTKVIDRLTQKNFHRAFQNVLAQYNKCVAAGGDYFEGDNSFMYVLSRKVPIRKKYGNLSYATRKCKNSSILTISKNSFWYKYTFIIYTQFNVKQFYFKKFSLA